MIKYRRENNLFVENLTRKRIKKMYRSLPKILKKKINRLALKH